MAGFTIGELLWRVVVDSAKAVKEAKLIERTFRGVAKGIGAASKAAGSSIIGIAGSLGKLSFSITKVAAVGLTALGAAAVYAGSKLVTAASNAQETNNKFNVLTEGLVGAEDQVLKLADAYGLSDNAAKTLVSSTADILQGFGVAKDRSLELSLATQRLAADLVSFSNVEGGTERASAALTAAFTGEREALKAYGIVISEEAVKQELLRQGKDKLTGAALLQAKAEATLKLAYEQSGNAIGDFARSQSSFANQLRIAQANVENLEVTLGTNLIPIAGLGLKVFNELADQTNELAQEMNDFITSAEGAEKIGDVFGRVAGTISAAGQLAQPIIDGLGEAFETITNAFRDAGSSAVRAGAGMNTLAITAKILGLSIQVVAQIIGLVIRGFADLGRAVISVGGLVSDFFRLVSGDISGEQFQQTISGVGDAFSDMGSNIKDGILDIAKTARDGYDDIKNNAQALADQTADAYKKTSETVKNAVQKSLLATQEAGEDAQKTLADTGKQAEKTGDSVKKFIDDFKTFQQQASAVAEIVGTIFDTIEAGQEGQLARQLQNIDEQEQRALQSAGLLEDTELERLQKQLDKAIETGDTETADELRQQIARQKITQRYEKQRRQAEYEAALSAWELQKLQVIASTAIAAINAFSATAAIPVVGPILAPIAAVTAGIFGAVQLGELEKARPRPPKFATGGIIPGAPSSGDRIAAQVNPGEMILNQAQQKNLFDMANNGGSGDLTVIIGKEVLFKIINRGIRDGLVRIPEKRTVAR